MDGGWADYKRSLSGFSSFDSGISTLKDKVTSDKTKGFELDKLNLGDAADTFLQTKETLQTVGENSGGLATTMMNLRNFNGMKKLLGQVRDKVGAPEPKSGEKNSVAEPIENKADSSNKPKLADDEQVKKLNNRDIRTRNVQEGEEGDVAPRPQDLERPVAEQPAQAPKGQEVEMSGMEGKDVPDYGVYDAQKMQSKYDAIGNEGEIEGEEPNFGGETDPFFKIPSKGSTSAPFLNKPQDTLGDGKEDFPDVESDPITKEEGLPSESGGISNITGSDTGLAVDAAADAGEVAADASVGAFSQILDAIPLVGEVLGAAVGIGAAIAGGFASAAAAKDQAQEAADSKAELSINAASSIKNQFGNSVTPTLTSLAQMPSNSGIF